MLNRKDAKEEPTSTLSPKLSSSSVSLFSETFEVRVKYIESYIEIVKANQNKQPSIETKKVDDSILFSFKMPENLMLEALTLLASQLLHKTKKEIQSSEQFETFIIKNALSLSKKLNGLRNLCPSLGEKIDVTGHAQYNIQKDSVYFVYKNLSEQQISEVVSVYKKYFGDDIVVVEKEESKSNYYKLIFKALEFAQQIIAESLGVRHLIEKNLQPLSVPKKI